jgi:predicted secreted hydrolase
MVYTIRDKDGSIDPYSSGTYIGADGSVTHVKQDEFKIEVSAKWRSPVSKADYPARWTVRVPTLGIKMEIAPLLADQELRLSFTYWEGAVHFTGQHAGQAISGEGYIEMTGYAQSIQGQF